MPDARTIRSTRNVSIAARIATIAAACLLGTSSRDLLAGDDVVTTAKEHARVILDDAVPEADRKALIAGRTGDAAALMNELVKDLRLRTQEEYRRIPWIWRVTVAAGKRNNPEEVQGVLAGALPEVGQELRDWQAVVIGGGIINGITLSGQWPQDTLDPLLAADSDLAARWDWTLRQSSVMADNDKLPIPTRYDALRIIGLRPWNDAGGQLFRYLIKGTHDELQQGAIGGLGDMRSPAVPQALLSGWPHYTPSNRQFVIGALLRNGDRARALSDAINEGRIAPKELSAEQRQKLDEWMAGRAPVERSTAE